VCGDLLQEGDAVLTQDGDVIDAEPERPADIKGDGPTFGQARHGVGNRRIASLVGGSECRRADGWRRVGHGRQVLSLFLVCSRIVMGITLQVLATT
jgi:hypothetical protein